MPLGQYVSQKQRGAYSVSEFCEAFGLSVPLFYKLRNKGRAPEIMKVGARTLISVEAAARWRRDCERAARQSQKDTPRNNQPGRRSRGRRQTDL